MKYLSDLDEAVLRCYNKYSAEYLREAIACYRAGAYRSAIVTTWNCVFFDLIEKIRELSLSGDSISVAHFSNFEAATERGDINRLLTIEREILEVARRDFEFIGELENLDLKRIQEDRNRCAHPTVNVSGEIFHPSPDLARSHIVHAIDHLLSFPPTHGKTALNRLLDDVKSEYFPTTVPKALEALQQGPLSRARKSLARNFLVVMLKVVARNEDYRFTARASAAIKAFAKINHQVYLEIVQEELSKIIRNLPDAELVGATRLIGIDAHVWSCLASDQKHRIEGFFENMSGDDLLFIQDTHKIKELEQAAKRRASTLSVEHIRDGMLFDLPRVFIDRLITLYEHAYSFDQANLVGRTFIENKSDLTEQDAANILEKASGNGQVTGSYEYPRLLNALLTKFPDSSELKKFM